MSEKYLILMSDNREIVSDINKCDYNTLTSIINYNYAKKHGYDYKYLQPLLGGIETIHNCYSPTNNLRHASWSKILSVLKIIDNFPEYTHILYLDTDCVFNNIDLKIEDYLSTSININNEKLNLKKSIFFMNNQPWNYNLPCAGFFIIKNNQTSKNFLKQWYNDVSEPIFNTNHPWEQITIQFKLNDIFNDCSEIINDWMFRPHKGQYLRHIGSEESQNRIPFFKKKIINDLNDVNVLEIIDKIKENTLKYNTDF
jgi:hypothetical protein